MIKEKYTRLHIHSQLGGICVINIHRRWHS